MTSPVHAPSDAATAYASASAPTPRRPRLLIAATILASSLAFIDGSVVNVGLPAIGKTFDAGATELLWVVNAYLLPLSALLLLGGAAGDSFGRRRALIVGVSLFALSSVACALAPNIALLLVARLVQGAAAALLMPNSLAILGSAFSGEAKGRAIGIWAAVGAATGALGPILGGSLIDLASWRLIFLINVPIAIFAICLAFLSVPKDYVTKDTPLDGLGALLATIGLGLSTWALTESSSRGWSAPVALAFATGLIVLVGFVLVERHLKEAAMMPLALFGSTTFVGLTLLTVLLYAALGGLLVLVPYVLIVSVGYSATQAAAALLPLPLVLSLVSPIAGSVAARVSPRPVLIGGPLVVAAGFLLATRIGAYDNYWTSVFPAMLAIALGLAGAVAPLTTAVLMSVDDRHTGSASGFNSAVARTGGLIATALIAPVMIASGPALRTAFETAAILGAVTCVAASLSAYFWIRLRANNP
jgi:EmrB/QacA subfamily drug resistance transporter